MAAATAAATEAATAAVTAAATEAATATDGLEAARLLLAMTLPGGDADTWIRAPVARRERALALAGAAHLDLLLATALRARARQPLPEALGPRAAAAKAAAAWAWVEGAAVLDALERAGLEPIALKGADLAARAYPALFPDSAERAYLRHATDLDVLVRDPARAEAPMRELDFVADAQGAAHHVRWRKRGGVLGFSVELHDDLFDRPHGLRVDAAALRARAVSIAAPDGAPRRVLAPTDAFLHVALHAVWSDVLRDAVPALRGPVDAVALALATKADGAALARAALDAGAGGAMGAFLGWCGELLGGALPAPLRDARASLAKRRFGVRVAAGQRRVRRNACRALDGARPIAPATVDRALLAPRWGTALAMLVEGFRRRRRRR